MCPSAPPVSGERRIVTVDVPLTPDAVPRMLPALGDALAGGAALLPVPPDPSPVRADIIAAAAPQEPVDDDTALTVPTSGSTGRPKAVTITAAAVRAAVEATADRLGGHGRWLLAVPATHIAGVMVLARSVVAGTEPVGVDLSTGFQPALFTAASRALFRAGSGPRYTSLVGRQLAAVLTAGGDGLAALAAYDAVLIGGSAVDDALLTTAREAGVRIVTTYGSTETCGGCVYDGRPLRGVEAGFDDAGRIRLRGPVLASGYRLQPELSSEIFADGWFTTADTGRWTPDGALRVEGRLDDVAISGGVNVPLAAVDQAVSTHPDIAEALAVAVPDVEWGERIVVAVVPRSADAPPSLASVRTHVTRQAPAAYAPRELIIVERLPLLGSGKLDRATLASSIIGQPKRTDT